jgi:acyl transferase domain-containing protein
VAALPRRAPAIPWISAATAGRVEADQATDPHRWAERLAAEPRLGATLGPLLAERFRLLLPIGPAAAMSAAARTVAGDAGVAAIAAALPAAEDLPASAELLVTLGNLWLSGVEVDWKSYHHGMARRRVPLPTYPFERQRYWIEAPAAAGVPDRAEV